MNATTISPIESDTALLIIDVQTGFDDPYWGPRNQPAAEIRIGHLLAAFRTAERPVWHVQHSSLVADSPLRPDRPGFALKPIVAPLPDEPVVIKTVNSAFIGTDLQHRLRKQGIRQVVIVGLTTDHCVSTSTRMAANLGFSAIVVADATATFDRIGFDGRHYDADLVHHAALASLHTEFATVTDTVTVLEAILG